MSNEYFSVYLQLENAIELAPAKCLIIHINEAIIPGNNHFHSTQGKTIILFFLNTSKNETSRNNHRQHWINIVFGIF